MVLVMCFDILKRLESIQDQYFIWKVQQNIFSEPTR